MIILKEYKPEDWTKISDAVEPFMFLKSLEEFNKKTKRGIAVTATENGEIMACGGITYTSDTEGAVWVKVSRKCFKQSYRWARSIRETFRIMMDSIGSMTVTTYILNDFCKGERLAGLIGMKRTDDTEEFNGNVYNKYMVVI